MPPFRVPYISSPPGASFALLPLRPYAQDQPSSLPPPKEGGRKEKTFAPNLRGGGGEGGGNFCHNTSSNKSNFSPSFIFSFPSLLSISASSANAPSAAAARGRRNEEEYRWIRMGPQGEGGDRDKERKSPRTYLVAVLLYYCSTTRPGCSIYIERKDALISLLTPLTCT